jgi:anti-anti-sigma factor
MPTHLESDVRLAGNRAVIDLRGDIDGSSRDELAAAYDRAITGGASALLLNFADVDYINSTGIALIVGLLGRARAEGRTLAACGLSEHYREIFQVTRLSDFIAIYADESGRPAAAERS